MLRGKVLANGLDHSPCVIPLLRLNHGTYTSISQQATACSTSSSLRAPRARRRGRRGTRCSVPAANPPLLPTALVWLFALPRTPLAALGKDRALRPSQQTVSHRRRNPWRS